MSHPFRCPDCRASDDSLGYREHDAETGAFVCAACAAWFPVDVGIVDFAPPGARDDARRRAFWERFGDVLELAEPEAGESPGNARVQREFFDAYVGDYDRIVAETPFWRAHDALALGTWVARVPRGADVIDLGAGSGRCTVPLADHLDGSGELVSTDISFEMLRAARSKLVARGTLDRVRLVVADATRLGWLRRRSFDVAFAYGLLHHLDDPEPVWDGLDVIMREHANVLVHDNNASAVRGAFDALMRRRRLWDAEHEGHPVIALDDLRRWSTGHGFALHARTSVFVPPHLCNALPVESSRRLLRLTDALMNRIPGAARNGGIVLAEAFRGGAPLVMTARTTA